MVGHAHKVSQKGQIVVPAKYRKRLNINPSDRMNFRIRGNVLIVEKSQDTGGNIEYLLKNRGNYGEEHLTLQDIEDIVRDLLNQQFYSGENVITDRVGRKSVKVRGSDSIIEEVVSVLTKSAEPWLEGDYTQVLRNYAADLDIDFPTLLGKYVGKMRSMEALGRPEDRDSATIPFALAVGETLSDFRTRVGDLVTERLIKEATVVREFIKNNPDFLHTDISDEELEEIITDELAQNYSILMNLKVLKELAKVSIKSVGERPFQSFSTKLFETIFQKKAAMHEDARKEKSADEQPQLPSFDF